MELAEDEATNGDTFRASAYRKAAIAVKQHTVELTTGKEAMTLKGVGRKMGCSGARNGTSQIHTRPTSNDTERH